MPPEDFKIAHLDPDDCWFYINTSGTTGTPKVAEVSHEVMYRRALAIVEDFVTRETVFCALFAPSAFPYLARAAGCFANGCTIIHSRNPSVWRESGVNHLYGSVTQVDATLGNVSLPQKMPMIHVSGSKLSDKLALHLLDNFELVIDLYASSETNRSFKNIKRRGPDGSVLTVGKFTDAEVEIIDDEGNICGVGDIGAVRVRNSYLLSGYLNNQEAAAKSFRDGWFYSGDFGTWGPQGGLHVIGRMGDVINIGGIKISALEIDELIRTVDGIADAMTFANPQESGISEILTFVVFEAGIDKVACVTAVNAACLCSVGALRTPARLIEVSSVPRAHDGGAQRFKCQEIYRHLKDLSGAVPAGIAGVSQ
ncbi:MAG: fatty acid--CoA ligase family protein [Deltaproteobacteria bacterium]